MAGHGRQRAARLGIPALLVAGLAFVALWRVGAPPPAAQGNGAPAAMRPAPLPPLTDVADLLGSPPVGRPATLDNVLVRDLPSLRTVWIGETDADRVFVVLDPDVKRSHEARLVPDGRVSLIGLVRASPRPEVAMRQWSVDRDTADTLAELGTYLHVTEVRPAS